MAYIFMDESGCLGFDFSKAKTSRNFMITFLFVPEKRPLEKLVRRQFQKMSRHELKRWRGGVLHCNKANDAMRMRMLQGIAQHRDISVMLIRLNKKRVYTQLKDEKHLLYNYVTNILLDRVATKKLVPTDRPVKLIASRRETNRFLNDNFVSYLNRQQKESLILRPEIKTPAEEKGLQAVDFISWAAFRYYEHCDESYFRRIEHLVVENNQLFGAGV